MNKLRGIITSHPFFTGIEPAYLDILVHGAREVTFKEGEVIFREGEPADRLFLICEGRVALEAHEPGDGTSLVDEAGAGDVIGWSWLFPPFAWHFQARAVELTRAVVLNGAHLLVSSEKHPKFGYDLMKRVARVVIHRLQATRKQLRSEQVQAALDG